jgi:cyanophycinase
VRWLLALLLFVATAATSFATQPKGTLVIIGGAAKPETADIWRTIVTAAGGKGAVIAVFPTASDDPEDSGAYTSDILKKYGAVPFVVPLTANQKAFDGKRATANDGIWINRVVRARGVFFTGGAQERITDALLTREGGDTPMLAAIRKVYSTGGVIAGTSAGAAIMSDPMFRDPADQLILAQRGFVWGKDIGPGLGFLPKEILVDQHFLARSRLLRLLLAMRDQKIPIGIGIDEDTAVAMRGQSMKVIGKSQIVIATETFLSIYAPGDVLSYDNAGVPHIQSALPAPASSATEVPAINDLMVPGRLSYVMAMFGKGIASSFSGQFATGSDAILPPTLRLSASATLGVKQGKNGMWTVQNVQYVLENIQAKPAR